MLSATELLGAVLFIAGLTVMSIIDVAFANVNKVSMRRLVDGPRGKAASSIAALLDTRTEVLDRKSTRLNSSHQIISYAVFCLKKKKDTRNKLTTAARSHTVQNCAQYR